jgi:cytochrome c
MRTVVVMCLAIAGLGATSVELGWTQDFDTGHTEFLSACAGCHGPDGKGGGPATAKLKVKPPDLTALAKRNGGIFPVKAVYELIDGRAKNAAHGGGEMPIWGCRTGMATQTGARKRKAYKLKVDESVLDLSCDSEAVIGHRILAIVGYLSQIQQ